MILLYAYVIYLITKIKTVCILLVQAIRKRSYRKFGIALLIAIVPGSLLITAAYIVVKKRKNIPKVLKKAADKIYNKENEMYTYTSQMVSEDMKTKIMIHAAAIRSLVKLDIDGKIGLMTTGSRFNDDQQVFQAFCQKYVQGEQDALELNEGAYDEELPKMVEQALISAADCDYWYTYEKEY